MVTYHCLRGALLPCWPTQPCSLLSKYSKDWPPLPATAPHIRSAGSAGSRRPAHRYVTGATGRLTTATNAIRRIASFLHFKGSSACLLVCLSKTKVLHFHHSSSDIRSALSEGSCTHAIHCFPSCVFYIDQTARPTARILTSTRCPIPSEGPTPNNTPSSTFTLLERLPAQPSGRPRYPPWDFSRALATTSTDPMPR